MSTKLLNFVKPAIKRSAIHGPRCTNIVSRYVFDPAYKPTALSYAFQTRRYLSTSSINFSVKKEQFLEKKNEKIALEDKKKAEKGREDLSAMFQQHKLNIITVIVLGIALIYLLICFKLSTGRATRTVKAEDIDVCFEDVPGFEEAKIELNEIVYSLENGASYLPNRGLRKAAILYGPPGTEKLQLAKACAKEAGVNFVQYSGSDFGGILHFIDKLVNRRLIREMAPCILFIDGISDTKQNPRHHEHIQSYVTSLLSYIDNSTFNMHTDSLVDDAVVVLAATDRIDLLDEAIINSCRFDKKIEVGASDVAGRSNIFRFHLRKLEIKGDKEALAKYLAVKTPGMTGAQIKNICKEAALHSLRSGEVEGLIEKSDFDAAIDRVIADI